MALLGQLGRAVRLDPSASRSRTLEHPTPLSPVVLLCALKTRDGFESELGKSCIPCTIPWKPTKDPRSVTGTSHPSESQQKAACV